MGMRISIAACAAAKNLETVAEHEHHVGRDPREGVGEADDAEADRLRDPASGVAGELRLDFLIDGEALGANGVDDSPELGR